MTELSEKPGQRVAPQRVLRARSEESEEVVGFTGRELRVEVFVAASGLADEAVPDPDFDTGPLDRVKMDGDDETSQVGARFPQNSAQGEGGVLANATRQAHEEESIQIQLSGD